MKNLYALLIGINDYHPESGVSSLAGCEADVRNVQAFLEKTVPEEQRHIITLLHEQATYANIIHHFGKGHLLQAEAGDTVLIHYSGHGAREKAAAVFAVNAPGGKQETMVCYDSRLPGQYDLADKELGVLLARISAKGTHVVALMDCCHSGNILRKLANVQLGRSRQWDDRNTVRPLETYLDGYFVDKPAYTPSSRYILLAACKKTEKAYELLSNQGNFTTNLLRVLEEADGAINYADLFSQTRARMLQVSNDQNPQFEPYSFFNAHAAFLDPDKSTESAFYTVSFQEGQWEVEAGILQSLPNSMDEGVRFELFEGKQSVGYAETVSISLNKSVLWTEVDLDRNKIYQGQLRSLLVPRIGVALHASAPLYTQLLEAYEASNAIYFEFHKPSIPAPYALHVEGKELNIFRTADQMRIRTTIGLTPDGIQDIFSHLDLLCRWEKTLAIGQDERSDRRDVELTLVLLDDQRKPLRKTSDPEVIIDLLVQNRREQKMPFQLEARNYSDEDWEVSLFYFGMNYGIYALYNDKLPAHSTTILIDYISKDKPYSFTLNGKNEATDIFKMIVSKEKINTHTLVQKGFKFGARILGKTKGIGLPEESLENEILTDWFTQTIHCQVLRQEAKVGKQAINLAQNKIKIHANTSGFQANIALETTTSGTRSLSSNAIIAQLAAQQNGTLLSLGAATRSTSAPNTLILKDIANEAELKAHPLKIEVDAALKTFENLLPVTFDGTHIIPVGEVEQTEDGKAIITIDRLPDVAEERKRSLGKALKLCFLKLFFKSDAIQQLRWVDYSLPEIERRTEGILTRISDAENILLVIHGIIGDTKDIAECMRRAYDNKTYDLVLSFDYENLHTPIEETAKALSDKLKEHGLTPESSKKITILSHSMGGLVSRYFIEKLGGSQVVKHLIMAGTPNAGSAIAKITTYRKYGIGLLGFVLNSPWSIPIAASLLTILKQSQKLTPTLEQMDYDNHTFLKLLNQSKNPAIPYSIVAGHLDQYLAQRKDARSLMDKLYKNGAKLFYGEQSNDIAVSVNSILTISKKWDLETTEVACHHLNYFVEAESVKALYVFLERS